MGLSHGYAKLDFTQTSNFQVKNPDALKFHPGRDPAL
jgi:hypothetical protein